MEEYLQNLIASFVLLLMGVIVVAVSFISSLGEFSGYFYGLGLLAAGGGVGALCVTYSLYKLKKKLTK